MRGGLISVALATVIVAGSAAAAAEGGARQGPVITFVHPKLLESYCATWSPAKPNPDAVAEISRRIPEFQTAWDREGPRLMAEVGRVTGHPYSFREALAVLHACPDMPSWSAPLVIAAARYTEAAGGGEESGSVLRAAREGRLPLPKLPPRPLADFVYTVWHELQHRYSVDLRKHFPGGATPILRKYAGESEMTRFHLHLFAIERLVMRRLGREAEYQARRNAYAEKGYRNYVRAFEIVEAEGAERLVAEIRAVSGRK